VSLDCLQVSGWWSIERSFPQEMLARQLNLLGFVCYRLFKIPSIMEVSFPEELNFAMNNKLEECQSQPKSVVKTEINHLQFALSILVGLDRPSLLSVVILEDVSGAVVDALNLWASIQFPRIDGLPDIKASESRSVERSCGGWYKRTLASRVSVAMLS
jgi:hypothetical protein